MKDTQLLQSDEGLFFGTFNDLVIENHDIKLIENEHKIAQDIVKILLIQKGTHYAYPEYGTDIPNLINNRNISTLTDDISSQIIYALTYVKHMNANDTINIAQINKMTATDITNGFNILIELLLTNGQLLTIKKEYINVR